MAAQDDDLLRAEPLGGNHSAQPDSAIAHHRHTLPGSSLGDDGGVVPGAQHVGQREQGRHQRVVLPHGKLEQGAVGVGDAQRLGLRPVDAVVAEEGDVHAFGLQPLAAELAGAVGDRERHHHQIAPLERAHLSTDILGDPDRFVAHRLAGLARLHRRVRPQVAAADAGAGHAQDRVGRLHQAGIRDILDPNIACAVHHSCSHGCLLGSLSCSLPNKAQLDRR